MLFTLQLTAVLDVPVTVAVNLCVSLTTTLVEEGLTETEIVPPGEGGGGADAEPPPPQPTEIQAIAAASARPSGANWRFKNIFNT